MRFLLFAVFVFLSVISKMYSVSHLEGGIERRTGRVCHSNPFTSEGDYGISALKWKNIQIYDFFLDGAWYWNENWYLRSRFNLGAVARAAMSDKDYFIFFEDLEKDLFSSTSHSAGDGEFLSFQIGLGKMFSFPSISFQIAPILGVGFRQISLTTTGGYVVDFYVEEVLFIKHPYRGLCSSNSIKYYTFWFGFDYKWCLPKNFVLGGKAEGFFASSKSRKYWNMRDLRWSEKLVGLGAILEASLLYPLCNNRYAGIKVGYENWFTYALTGEFIFEPEEGTPEFDRGEKIVSPMPWCHDKFENAYVAFVIHQRF